MKFTLLRKDIGFTLMEVLAVVAIISILSTIAILNWQTITVQAKKRATLDELKQIATAETAARNDTSLFWEIRDLMSPTLPTRTVYGARLEDFGIRLNPESWKGPYLGIQSFANKIDNEGYPVDVWGRRYKLVLWAQDSVLITQPPTSDPTALPSKRCMVVSFGPDRLPGSREILLANGRNPEPYYREPLPDDWHLFAGDTASDDIFLNF